MARVDQQVDPLQVRPPAQIGAAEVLELVGGLARDLGETVAGQVDQPQLLVQHEEVHLARASGLGGGARQVLAPDQGVDQRRLAHVGASGEGHLGQVGRGQAVDLGGAHHELDRMGEQDARGLDLVVGKRVLVFRRHVAGALPVTLAMMESIGFSTFSRCMIRYCCRIDSTLDQHQ